MGQNSSSHPPNNTVPSTSQSTNTSDTATSSNQIPSLSDATGLQLRENLEAIHNQLMQHAGADFDIVTTTTLSYSQFLSYISKVNNICRLYQDDDGRVLVFAVKKGTDSSIFWKATVRIACVKYHTGTDTAESYRLLNIRQFLKVFRRISYECTGGGLGAPPSPTNTSVREGSSTVPPTTAASYVLGEIATNTTVSEASSGGETGGKERVQMEECVICLERQPEVILPCAHAYCLPCIQQWWEYSIGGASDPYDDQCSPHVRSVLHRLSDEKTCPVCREQVSDDDDTWVISEAPDDAQVTHEISKALMGLAEGSASCSSDTSRCHLSERRLPR